MTLPIAGTRALIDRSRQQERDRTRYERRRRRLVRLIDLAIGACERANLEAAGPGRGGRPLRFPAPPPPAAALVEWLQLDAGEMPRSPADSRDALDELFRLQVAYLPRLWVLADVDDQVADEAEPPAGEAS